MPAFFIVMPDNSIEVGKRFDRHVTAHVRQPEGTDNVIFEISNDALDRHGTQFDIEGISLDNYRNNPVVLWNHGGGLFGGGVTVPIGKTVNIQKRGDSLFAEVEFDKGDQFAADIERKVRNGFLNAASVGFIPRSIERGDEKGDPDVIEESELLEWSVVPVPSNPEALVSERELEAQEEIRRMIEEIVREVVDEHIENRSLSDYPVFSGARGDMIIGGTPRSTRVDTGDNSIDGEELAKQVAKSLPKVLKERGASVVEPSSETVEGESESDSDDPSTERSLDEETATQSGEDQPQLVRLSIDNLKQLREAAEKARREKAEKKAQRKYKRLTGRA